MTKTLARLVAIAALLFAGSGFAATGGNLQQAGIDLGDKGSLQRGAQLYMNYCAACHSIQYMRYSRIAEDLGLTEEQVMQNLNFTGANFGDQVKVPMTAKQGEAWFGKMPPDLSVISRVRGADWIYTYLKSFYLDASSPAGWNNTVLLNASMPNVLWELQGVQHAEFGPADATGQRPVQRLVVTQPGTQDSARFDQSVRDVTAFLEYVGEPAVLKRQTLGVWVMLFLAILTFLAWLLKKEYWRDVH
ncbi:MAG: cytochrome c1 [Pseudoxanthomonas suwonensis]|nr:cytochrome c1 [Pseudoxanthomonas suwonensis]